MPKIHVPRRGSMQYWPRKYSKRVVPRVRSWPKVTDVKLLGFLGYKVGMTTVIAKDDNPHSLTKNQNISVPVTVLECPPMRVLSIKFYKNGYYSKSIITEFFVDSNKYLRRRFPSIDSKKVDVNSINADLIKNSDDLKVVLYSQPYLTNIGKKTPDFLEVEIGGNTVEEKFNYIKKLVNKDILISDVFEKFNFVDIRSITKGKGFQGPVKRFGISLRFHKSEKTKRGPGSLGPWMAQGHIMYRVSHAGQMGFHQRNEFNKLIVNINKNLDNINVSGGYPHYGVVKNEYVLIKGSVSGSQKRAVVLTYPMRNHKKEQYTIREINLDSKQ